jgi:hypothetical protein
MRTSHLAAVSLFVVGALAACGSNGGSPGPFTVAANLPFAVASEVAFSGFVNGTFGAQSLTIYIGNRPEVTCATAPSLSIGNTRLASLDLLTLDVVNENGVVEPGTYNIVSPRQRFGRQRLVLS